MRKQRALGFVVAFFAFMMLAVIPAFAQEAPVATGAPFTTQIPAGWNDESTPDYSLYIKGDVSVYLLVADESDVQAGIEAAVRQIVPDFNATPVASSEIPLPNGAWTQNVYVTPEGAIQVALAQVSGGATYVILILLPDQAALAPVQGDVNTILLNATIGTPLDLSDQQPAMLDDKALADIQTYVDSALSRYGVYGAEIAIVQDGEVVYSNGFGTLARGDDTPVTDSTLFMIGSVTKSMTTMMTATLVDDGVISWDTPATDILPDFALSDSAATAKIEWRDLFNMTSGIPRFDIPFSLEAFTPARVEQEIAGIPLATQPGKTFHYSNFMVALGGYADAVASGAALSDAASAYNDLMQTRVFDPIGMSSTTLDFDTVLANPNHALPHSEDPMADEIVTLPIKLERALYGVAPAGAVWSNAQDMAKYMITQINRGIAPGGERVVSEANLLETWKPEIAMPGGSQYGMGWMIDSYHGQRLIMHGGNTAGFTADFAFLPDADLGVVVLSNLGLSNSFCESIREYVFETAFGLDHTADAFYAATEQALQTALRQVLAQTHYSDTPVDPQAVADYLGSYQRNLEIQLDDAGQLVARTIYTDMPLLPTDNPQRFVTAGVMSGMSITFSKDASGGVSATLDSLLGVITNEPQSLTLAKID